MTKRVQQLSGGGKKKGEKKILKKIVGGKTITRQRCHKKRKGENEKDKGHNHDAKTPPTVGNRTETIALCNKKRRKLWDQFRNGTSMKRSTSSKRWPGRGVKRLREYQVKILEQFTLCPWVKKKNAS